MKVLPSIYQQIWKTQQWSQNWKMSVFIPVPKNGNAKECSNYQTIAIISHFSKVIPKILLDRFQHYLNWEIPEVRAGFRKGVGTRDQIANIRWIIEKAREFQKNIYFCFIDYTKAFVWITINWQILKEMGIPEHLACLLRNMYAGQEATVRTGHEQQTTSKLRKECIKGVCCHPADSTYMPSTSCEMPGWKNSSWNQGCLEKYQ